MNSFDAVVIGASAVGGVAARELAFKGLDVALCEEHAEPGKFGKCTALVSAAGLKETGVDFDEFVLNEIRGAVFKNGKRELVVDGRTTKAFVLDRQGFDAQSVRQAVGAGAKLKLNARFEIGRFDGARVDSSIGGRRFTSRFLVGADGAASSVAKAFGFPSFERVVVGWQAEALSEAERPGFVELFLEPEFKGFFGWRVPLNGKKARVGFCVSSKGDFASAKKKLFELAKPKGLHREFAAAIPLKPRRVTQKQNVFLVGDAAGQVKATTGGGIVFGSRCARVLAECVASGKNYDAAWRRKYGGLLRKHLFLRRVYDLMPAAGTGFCLSASRVFSGVLSEFGDMDDLVKI